jgi:hypothetical protein
MLLVGHTRCCVAVAVRARCFVTSACGVGCVVLTRVDAHRYPPGHGDVYRSLCHAIATSSDMARVFEGKEFIFISNVDNLGALVRACHAARACPCYVMLWGALRGRWT